jgi:hypothetical protein
MFTQYNLEAEDDGTPLLKSVPALGKRLTNLKKTIERKLNVDWSEARGHGDLRLITLTPRNGGGDHNGGPAPTPKTDQDSNGGGGGDTSNFYQNNKEIENAGNTGGFSGGDEALSPESSVAPPSPESPRAPETQKNFSAGCSSTSTIEQNLTCDEAQTLAIAGAESIAHALVAIGFAKRLADDAARGFKRERRSSRGRYRAKF